jgi:hypothetical protein
MKRLIIGLVFVVASLAVFNPTSEAALVIKFSDVVIESGGTDFMDVMISGDSDPLSFFDFQIQITPVGTVSSAMRFIDPQPDPQLSDPFHSMKYVFVGNSDNVTNGFPMGFVSAAGTTFDGIDVTADFSDVIVDTERLLVRLALESVVPGGGDASGDRFEVTLTAANFFDSNATPILYTTNSGFANIGAGATPVPEPSSFAVLAGAFGFALFWKRRKRIGRFGGLGGEIDGA